MASSKSQKMANEMTQDDLKLLHELAKKAGLKLSSASGDASPKALPKAKAFTAQSSGVVSSGAMHDGSKRRADSPSAFSESSDFSELELVSETFVCIHVQSVPLPRGVDSFKAWGNTLVTMPKVKHMKLSFKELLEKAPSDHELIGYCRYIWNRYGAEYLQPEMDIKNQATDLAFFMLACNFHLEVLERSSGYQRQQKA